MFQGSFYYYKKGPCHIQETETAAKKKAYKANLNARNTEVEAENKRRWEEKVAKEKAIQEKEYKQKKRGPKPKQKHTKANSAIIQEKGRGGINQYQY